MFGVQEAEPNIQETRTLPSKETTFWRENQETGIIFGKEGSCASHERCG